MNEEKYITMVVDLKDFRGKPVGCRVVIKDEYAILTFTDPNLALKWYDKDKHEGNVKYNKKINAVMYHYKGKTKEEIREQYREEIKQAGGKER